MWNEQAIPDLNGKTIVVTGASAGLGAQSTRILSSKGAHIILACRNVSKGEQVAATIKQELQQKNIQPSLDVMQLDLSRLPSIREFANAFSKKYQKLDVLMNNAGVMALPQEKTVDGFEMQLGTNHFGHFALTGLLLPILQKTAETEGSSRVVNISSMAHRMGKISFVDDVDCSKTPYDRWQVYGNSKLANLLFSFELARRLQKVGSRVSSLAAHPGYADTELQDKSTAGMGARGLMRVIMSVGNALLAQSVEQGVLPQLRAATDAAAQSGSFYGPDGFQEARGRPVVVKAKPYAYDETAARRLWEISTERTGVTYTGL